MRKGVCITVCLLSALLPLSANAAESFGEQTREGVSSLSERAEQKEVELVNLFLAGEQEGRRKASEQLALPEKGQEANTPKQRSKTAAKTPNLEEELSDLVDQVDRLKSEVVLTKQNALATRTPRSNKSLGAITKYVFDDSQIFEVHTAVNRATEILLQPGEELTMAPVAGDTELWIFAVMHSGSGRDARAHVLVRPRVEGIETNVILATNRRTYRLQAVETGTYMPAVKWSYPKDEMAKLQATYKRKKEEVRGVDPTKLRYGYDIDGDDVRWRPLQAFDDGRKTYIQLPGAVKHREAPAIFILNEDDEPMLVTSRPKGDFLVVDRLFDRAELRIGERSVEIIAPDYERESLFERLF